MAVNKVGKDISRFYAERYGTHEEELAHTGAYQEMSRVIKPVEPRGIKPLGNIREAIEKIGLRDGVAIPFHRHFHEGDYVINLILAEIAAMGLENILIAPSSIANVHRSLIEHIKSGIVTNIISSGLRDEVGAAISAGIMEDPMVIRSHSDWVWAVTAGDVHIDVALLGTSSSDAYGNANRTKEKATCGSLGYVMANTKYTGQVVIITDTLVSYSNAPISVPQTNVDYVVEIDVVGDPDGIAKGATRFTKNLKELLIAEYATKIITHSSYHKEGFSFQTRIGNSSLAATRFMREQMSRDDIRASFALDGITNAMVEPLEEGLVEKIIDAQDSDHPSAISLGENANYYGVDTNMYASPFSKGAIISQLGAAILPTLEVDTDFNANVITGSDGVTRGASGGHFDTSMACKMGLVIVPFVCRRIPTIVGRVNIIITPGTGVDVVAEEIGIVVNPKRTDLIDCFKALDVPQFTLEELRDKAYNIVGIPEPIRYGDKVVTLIEYRDGSLIDAVRNV